jgi:hypothetical protein
VKVTKLMGPLGMALTAAEVGWLVRQHWRTIPPHHRRRLGSLMLQSQGRLSRLSAEEREEVAQLVRGLELPLLLRRTAGVVALGRWKGRD